MEAVVVEFVAPSSPVTITITSVVVDLVSVMVGLFVAHPVREYVVWVDVHDVAKLVVCGVDTPKAPVAPWAPVAP